VLSIGTVETMRTDLNLYRVAAASLPLDCNLGLLAHDLGGFMHEGKIVGGGKSPALRHNTDQAKTSGP
jgi:hypothetical protein